MQAENDALQSLVLEVAANKAEAKAKVARLKEKYDHLLRKACTPLHNCLLCCLSHNPSHTAGRCHLPQSSPCMGLLLGPETGGSMGCSIPQM